MTPYSYTIILGDREMMALTWALAHYQAVCEDELANGMEVPFRGHREAIKKINAKLFDRINTPEGTFTKDELPATPMIHVLEADGVRRCSILTCGQHAEKTSISTARAF